MGQAGSGMGRLCQRVGRHDAQFRLGNPHSCMREVHAETQNTYYSCGDDKGKDSPCSSLEEEGRARLQVRLPGADSAFKAESNPWPQQG